MLYGPLFQCVRMGGGYLPLIMYRDTIGSNKYFRSHSAFQLRGGGGGSDLLPNKGYQSSDKNIFLLISPIFPSFLLISPHTLHLSEDFKNIKWNRFLCSFRVEQILIA